MQPSDRKSTYYPVFLFYKQNNVPNTHHSSFNEKVRGKKFAGEKWDANADASVRSKQKSRAGGMAGASRTVFTFLWTRVFWFGISTLISQGHSFSVTEIKCLLCSCVEELAFRAERWLLISVLTLHVDTKPAASHRLSGLWIRKSLFCVSHRRPHSWPVA